MFNFLNPSIVLDVFKAIYKFFKSSENQHLATWIQTFAIVGGVVVALNQLDKITQQEQINSNKKYMEIAQKYSKVVHLEYNRILKHHQHSKSFTMEQFYKRYPKGSILKSRQVLEDYIEELSLCGVLAICPRRLVNSIVCERSKRLYTELKTKLRDPSGIIISSKPPFFYKIKIDNHCGFIDRTLFRINA
jgi:hypothetical protein